MLRIKFLLGAILALTAWIHPAYAISAFAEQPQDNPTFINYDKFHVAKSIEAPSDNQKKVTTRVLVNGKRSNTGKSIPESYSGRNYSKDEVIELIKSYSAQYGIKPEMPLCIALKESGYNQLSANKSSSARGVFQYLSGTWAKTDEGLAGLSVFDADANVKAAIKYMAIHKKTTPWVVASGCPKLQKIN